MSFLPFFATLFLLASFAQCAPEGGEEGYNDADYYKVGDMVFHRGEMRAGALGMQWPQGKINYFVDSKLPKNQQKLLAKAMELVQSKSCIRFKKYDSDAAVPSSEPYMKFIPGEFCQTQVGYHPQMKRPHIVEIETPQCGIGKAGDIAHEIFHALGFYHEQTRKDRDLYVKINESNILEGFENNFEVDDDIPFGTSYYDVAYNYDSIMHYGPWFASKNPATLIMTEEGYWNPEADPHDRTIIALQSPKGPVLGKVENMGLSSYRNFISKGDELMLERMYWNECRRNKNGGIDYPPFPDEVTWKPETKPKVCRKGSKK